MSNIEEDIKILENLKKYLNLLIYEGTHKIIYNDLGWDEKTIDCINAIDHILEEREEDKKRIAELEAKLEFYQWGDLDNLKFEEYMKEFIPKQKVKDKMKEIKVGEYGRTNKGKMFIFAWLENSNGKRYTNKVLLGNGKIFENKFYYFDDGEEIVKHSKNIIDLIDIGDYVNGNEVLDKYLLNGEIPVLETTGDETNVKCMCEGDIRIILTKEQYQANCYTVERKEE